MTLPTVVCLSTIDWHFLRQRHQILMAGLAKKGFNVIYVENFGGRTPRPNDFWRIVGRIKRLVSARIDGAYEEDGVKIITPFLLPLPQMEAVNIKFLLPRIIKNISRFIKEPLVLYDYSPTRYALEIIDALHPSLLIYDCVANLKGYAFKAPSLIAAEDEIVQRANLVITDSRFLFDEKSKENPHAMQLPPGVNFDLFSTSNGCVAPLDLIRIPKPRLCFFGTLGWWVDIACLSDFAMDNPQWSLVLLGDSKVASDALLAHQNVFHLGIKRHDELPAYLHAMDVLCIPYVDSEFSKGVFPAKTFEAFATGKPIVTFRLNDLLEFADLIDFCGPEDFSEKVREAVKNDTPERRNIRIAIASQNSWTSRIETVASIIESECNKK